MTIPDGFLRRVSRPAEVAAMAVAVARSWREAA